jgi:prolyl-tRNA editing enzyme YbaK/EbsC (Cys-tRNA(Pro) deacylase)
MSVQDVREYLKAYGAENEVLEFPVSSATVELAAKAVGVESARIAKTLSFADGGGERCLLLVTAGDARVDNAKFRARFGFKARMLTPEQVKSMTGHSIGGVCPFAIAEDAPVSVCLDESMKRFDTVYPAAGSGNSAVKLTPDELFAASRATAWVDVCRDWE